MVEREPVPVATKIRQSPPLDTSAPYDPNWIKGKHILITGGASGFGAGFVEHWVRHGASVAVGDINIEGGMQLVNRLKKETGNSNVHFFRCDVTDWSSQVQFFKETVKCSPHGGIDMVVANAGIAGIDKFEMPTGISSPDPPPPKFKVLDVNLYGVMYTAHLALYYLPRNPGSGNSDPDSEPSKTTRDRHLLLLGSMASIAPIPTQPQYGTAKHGVLGLFRTLRCSSFVQGVRVNLLLPYFIDTPIIPMSGKLFLAGGAMGKVEDVVDAATRFAADSRILGRAVVVGPKIRCVQKDEGEWMFVPREEKEGKELAYWEAYADDTIDSELFMHNMVRLLSMAAAARGWSGYINDILRAVLHPMRSLFGR